MEELVRHGVDPDAITVAWAPGAYELPLVCQRLANMDTLDVVVGLGCVIRGATAHFDYVAGGAAKGLLGLNVSGAFRTSIDRDRGVIELAPRVAHDRKDDVAPWIALASKAHVYWDGRVEIEIDASNRARQAVESAVVEVTCTGDRFGIRIGPIPAEGSTSRRSRLPRGTACRGYTVTLREAAWRLDRFDD